MIDVQHLCKTYGAFSAVDDLSFTVATGQTLALVGTSGCGKTTTLKMINRLIEPTAGQVLINEKDTRKYDPVQLRREIGYVIQSVGLFPHYTIEENIAIVPKLLGWAEEKIHRRVYALMDRLGLAPAENAHKYPHQLSGGQQQRVGIARALAADPPIILMDEPFGALDPITRADIRSDFMEMEELSDKTTVLVTHDVEEAFAMADLICLLDRGQIQQLGTPRELLFQPANDFVRQFLADKRLQLEFHSVRVRDVWDQLTDIVPAGRSSIEIAPDLTIFKAMSVLTRHAQKDPLALTRHENQSKYYELGALVTAFHREVLSRKD